MNDTVREILNTFFLWIVLAIVAIFKIMKARWRNKRSR